MATETNVLVTKLQVVLEGQAQIERARKAMEDAGQSTKRFAENIKASNSALSGAATQNIKNVSFQMQDLIVQLNGGTDAARAFGQQLPQLLAGFGAFGAVAGTVAAFAPQIIGFFKDTGDSAKKSLEGVDQITAGFKDVQSLADDFDLKPVIEAFNKLDAQARQTALGIIHARQQLSELNLEKLNTDLSDTVKGFATAKEGFLGMFGGGGSAVVDKVGKDFGMMATDAQKVSNILVDMHKGTLSLRDGMDALNTSNVKGNATYGQLKVKLTELYLEESKLYKLRSAASDFTNKATKAGPTNAIPTGETARIKEATKAVEEYDAAIQAQRAVMSDLLGPIVKVAEAQSQLNQLQSVEVIQMLDSMGVSAEAYANKLASLKDVIDPATASLRVWTEQLLGKGADDPIGKYAVGIEKLDQALAKNIINLEQHTEGVRLLQAQMAPAAAEAEKLGASMQVAIGQQLQQGASGLVDLFFQADQSFRSFAANFLKQIAKMIMQMVVLNTLKTAFTFFGFSEGGATKSATGLPQGVYTQPTFFRMPTAGMHKFASGGVVSRSIGLLGEAGPEAIMPLKRTASGALGVEATGGGGNTIVNINNYGDNTVKTEERTNNSGDRIIDVMIEKKLKGMVTNGSMDSTFRSVYGLSRRPA